jgi:apolipoprotein N-acyltransferase
LSRSQPLDNIDLVVWGETATPYDLNYDDMHKEEITTAIPPHGYLATGILRESYEQGNFLLYNSLYIIDSNGNIKDYYDKSHLVPFGEYLPFRDYLPKFMSPVTNIVGELGHGEKYKPIRIKNFPLMSGAICYESIFPKETILFSQKTEILLVIANDGWYGISRGPYQHLAAAQMRAAEEGITVIRSANTGISAIIDDKGKILSIIPLNAIDIKDTILPTQLTHQTLYGKYGNIIPLTLALALLIMAFIFNKKIS